MTDNRKAFEQPRHPHVCDSYRGRCGCKYCRTMPEDKKLCRDCDIEKSLHGTLLDQPGSGGKV